MFVSLDDIKTFSQNIFMILAEKVLKEQDCITNEDLVGVKVVTSICFLPDSNILVEWTHEAESG